MAIKSLRAWRFVGSAVLGAAVLSGCGGGGSSVAVGAAPTTSSLSGVAAVGVPIVGGSITVTCSGGGSVITTTGVTGAWTVSTAGYTLPCAVQVKGGTVNGTLNTTPYHSIAMTFGTANVTPLTDLAVAQLLGDTPQNWFANPTFAKVNATNLSAAVKTVSTNLGLTSALGTTDPFTATFSAVSGDKLDNLLEALKTTLSNQKQTYANLLAAAQSNGYASFTGFGTAFSTVYVDLTNTGTGTSTGTGTANLTVEVSTSLGTTSTIFIKGVTKPSGQTDFCSFAQNDSSITALNAAGGSLTINSCTFSGSVGNIAATVAITTPINFSTSYTIKYTYN